MLKRSKKLLMLCPLFLLISKLVMSYPMGNTTTLPPPKKTFDKEDLPLLTTLLSMPVYPDSKKEHLYYYVPFFRIFQYDQGAGTMMINSLKIDNILKANNIMSSLKSEDEPVPDHIINNPVVASKREDVIDAKERMRWASDELKRISEDMVQTKAKLETATKENNQNLIDFYKNSMLEMNNEISSKKEELNKYVNEYNAVKKSFDDYVNSREQAWRQQHSRTRLYGVVTHLASAGISIDMKLHSTTESLVVAINDTIDELKKSYGGSLTMGIYSGFTEKQIRDIRTLKTKYWPEIQIMLMPANELKFVGLTQMEDSKDKPRENVMFKSVKGSGGYHGATVNFDLTVDGATSLGMALEPFILPVGVSAEIRERVEAYKGRVSCNYNNDFWMHGRADVTDGWFIFSNDISNNIKTKTNNNGNCEVVVEKGDPESVYAEAIKKIEENFENNFFKKTYLNQAEAQAYYANAVSKLDEHASSDRGESSWLKYLIPFFGNSLTIQTLSTVRKSYWHTSKYNTGDANRLSFSHKIDVAASESVRKDMPAILCLFYNSKKHSYDRCTAEQEIMADGSVVAARRASTSPECKDVKTIYECMANRTQKIINLLPQKEEKVVDNLLDI